MPQYSRTGDGYKRLAESLTGGQASRFYIFHGEERYLLERSLDQLRKLLCPGGLDGFNYKRFEGKNITIDDIDDSINTLPAFADRTLVEIHDFDIFKSDDKKKLGELFSDLPDYACIVFIFNVIAYKPDGRTKADKEILKNADIVEFTVQGQDSLVKWIKRHFKDAGKTIGTVDAEYLVLITGGYMSAIFSEIGKTAAYAKGDVITRKDIDAVVIPILDAVVYKLTDALMRRKYTLAMRILDELLRMREAPQKLLFNISLKMRQLLAARICIESSLDKNALIEMCGIRHEFQARSLMDTARETTLKVCRDAVLLCADTAYALNSSAEPEAHLTELVLSFAKLTTGKLS